MSWVEDWLTVERGALVLAKHGVSELGRRRVEDAIGGVCQDCLKQAGFVLGLDLATS